MKVSRILATCCLLLVVAVVTAACSSAPATPTAAPQQQPAKPATGVQPAPAAQPTQAPAAAARQTIKVGLLQDLSGVAVDWGVAVRDGATLAAEEYNADAGKKYAIQLVTYDDESNNDKSLQLATRLVEVDKVVGIIGPTSTGPSMAVAPMLQKAGNPTINADAMYSDLTTKFKSEPTNYFFRVSMENSQQMPLMLGWAKTKGLTKMGVIYSTLGFGTDMRDTDLKARQSLGLAAPVVSVPVEQDQLDLTPQALKVKEADPQLLQVYLLPEQTTKLLQAFKKIGYQPKMSSVTYQTTPSFYKMAGELVDGLLVPQYFDVNAPKPAALHQKMLKRFNKDDMPTFAATGYDAMNMLLKAIDKVGPDGKKIPGALEAMDDWSGVNNISKQPFSKTNHEAFKVEDFMVGAWMKDGKIQPAK